MVRHQKIIADQPCCGRQPGFVKKTMRLWIGQPGSSIFSCDSQQNKIRPVQPDMNSGRRIFFRPISVFGPLIHNFSQGSTESRPTCFVIRSSTLPPGPSRAARQAGRKPETTPVSSETSRATATMGQDRVAGKKEVGNRQRGAPGDAQPDQPAHQADAGGLDQKLQQNIAPLWRRWPCARRSHGSARPPKRT